MRIISHRGYWQSEQEKNTAIAFRRSFSLGFGTETDIRDQSGELVISHDPPVGNCLSCDEFFALYSQYDRTLPLALNVKADGLQDKLIALLTKYNITNYFVFDMAIPDGLIYFKKGLKVFTRQSEYEKEPSFYQESAGVWLDCFVDDWIDEHVIASHLQKQKKICIVSPELHKRDYKSVWTHYSRFQVINSHGVMICTDKPEECASFFDPTNIQ